MELVRFDFSYMFMYSERPGTLAEKRYKDDVMENTKKRRLAEIIQVQSQHSLTNNQKDLGKVHRVLIEGDSRRSPEFLQGRTSANKVVVFPKRNKTKGQYVNVKVERCTGATLIGEIAD
jgi:tRNA-2-methylthio-N6-dimethylallyladenosine synthase